MPRIEPIPVPSPREGAPSTSMYAHVPSIAEGTRALDKGIGDAGGISPQLRRLMNVKAALMVGCPF